MNKKELVDVVAGNTGATKKAVTAILEDLFATIIDTVANDDEVRVAGFGVFENVMRSERKGVNPQTKEYITIPAKKVVKFRAGKEFKDAVL